MAKAGTVVIDLDANTAKLLKGIKTSQKQLSQLERTAKLAKNNIANFAKAAGAVYILKQAVDVATYAMTEFMGTSSGFEQYENRMDAFTNSVTENKSELARATQFALDYRQAIEGTTETLLTMKNYGLKDGNEQLKIYGNTAIGSGKSISQFAEAMADALTGENERLKEFGVKASKIGEKIGYVWTDSSGKTRNVIVDNNKEVIDSTLSAIFNEKYVGQMEAYRDSWKGITQGMSNSWTIFTQNISSARLFAYIKSLARVISSYMTKAFGDATIGAKGFSDSSISYINGTIKAVGFLKDAVSGMLLGFKAIEYAVLFMSKAVMQAINLPGQAINYLMEKYNALGDVLGFQKIDINAAPLIDTTWTDKTMASLKSEMSTLVDGLMNNSGQKLADKVIEDTKKGLGAVKNELALIDAEHKKAVETLAKLGAGEGGLASTNTKAIKAQTKAIKEQDKAVQKLFESTHTDEEIAYKKLGDELSELGKHLSQADLAKIYASEIKKMEKSTDSLAETLQKAFDIDSDGMLGRLMDSFDSMFDGLISSLIEGESINQMLSNLGPAVTDFMQKSGDPTLEAVGYAAEFLGAALSNVLSEAEILAATGRSEFDSQSLSNMRTALESAQEPMLVETRSMLRHLESMDQKFGSIANAISSSTNGLDLDGSDFQATATYGFAGFSSSQTELLGAGIEFGKQTVAGFLEGVDAIGYEAVKVTSSSFWGLVQSEKIKEVAKDLPQGLRDDISKAFGEGITAVMEAVDILGFDTDAIQAKLDQYVLDLGKLNFKDLNAEEQSQALSNAMSEQLDGAFSQAISSIASPQNIQALENMARVGESYTETLVRAAVQHETVSTQLALFNQTVTDFATSDALVQAAGGLDAFKNAMSIFTQNFFTEEEQQAMQKQQLEMALAIQNIALPASKAQFRALVLETQQKIMSVKANIETMKAGIRADIAANNYKKLADESYVRSAISTANNINQAAVLIGTSAHDMLEAAKGAGVDANSIDYTDAYESDIGLQALEGELANLEAIYGTLMQNMGAFADYYGGVESMAGDAQDKLNDVRKAQIDLINKEIEIRNKLNKTIASMKDGVYGSFEKLLGKDVPQLVNNLRNAINAKDYASVSGAFNEYTSKLSDTAGSKEEFLRGVIGANALVQSVQGQEQMTLLDASLATEANTRETAYLNRIALGLQEDPVLSTERDNKLNRNNKLLEELIKLQKASNAQGATGLDLQAEKNRDDLAAELRARYTEASA